MKQLRRLIESKDGGEGEKVVETISSNTETQADSIKSLIHGTGWLGQESPHKAEVDVDIHGTRSID